MAREATGPAGSPAAVTRQDALAAAIRCYYAKGASRPHCEGFAVVAYGDIALCGMCDKMRSAVGRGIAPRKVPGVELHQLIAAARALAEAEHRLADAVHLARQAGASWSQVGDALGVTRQATQQRWGEPPDAG